MSNVSHAVCQRVPPPLLHFRPSGTHSEKKRKIRNEKSAVFHSLVYPPSILLARPKKGKHNENKCNIIPSSSSLPADIYRQRARLSTHTHTLSSLGVVPLMKRNGNVPLSPPLPFSSGISGHKKPLFQRGEKRGNPADILLTGSSNFLFDSFVSSPSFRFEYNNRPETFFRSLSLSPSAGEEEKGSAAFPSPP